MINAGLATAVWVAVSGFTRRSGIRILGYRPIVKRAVPQRGATNGSVTFKR